MNDLIEKIISTNPLITTIYSGGFVALLVMYSKSIFFTVYRFLNNLISFRISNMQNISKYADIPMTNLDIFLKKQKHIFQNSYEITDDVQLKEGFGLTGYWIFGKFVLVNKEYQHNPDSTLISTTMTVYFANKKKFLKKLYENIKNVSEIYENKISILYDYSLIKREKRRLNTIYINNNNGQKLLQDVKSFINGKDNYIKNNILYKRNYLLYGKPGTGKSSLILALASELNYKVRIINLSSIRGVSDLLYNLKNPENTFFVFEDIDAMTNILDNRENNDSEIITINNKETLTLSDILNILDGLYTSEGAICIFTTNHIEKLDSAFLRDGRMDYKLELTDLDNETANKMILDKLHISNSFHNEFINPATLQELIMQVKNEKITINEFKQMVNK